MQEYVLMDSERIVNIVLTNKTTEQVQRTVADGYKVVSIDEVPMQALRRYRYWRERS